MLIDRFIEGMTMKRCKIYVFALGHMSGDTLLYGEGEWITTPGVSINSCNDGIRTVVFKITRLDEEATDMYPQKAKE